MTVVLIPVFLVVFAALAVALALVKFQEERRSRGTEVISDPSALRYQVPEGQDPAVIVAELGRDAEYEVTLPPQENVNEVLIASPPGRPPLDREQVRDRLSRVRRTSLDVGTEGSLPPVRFADEAGGPGVVG